MYSLTADMSIASQALNAESGAVAITNQNISNVSTPGYSRELVNLSANALDANGADQENGITLGGFTSVRDQILQLSINQKTSDSASLTAQSTALSQLDTAFSGTSSGIGASLSSFFSALSSISTDPTSAATRQSGLNAAGEVANAFNQAANALSSAETSANATVSGTVAQINQMSTNIAALDVQLSQLHTSGQDGGSIEDQRDQLTSQLAQLIGISSTNTSATPSVGTAGGSPLVVGGTAYQLQAVQGTDGTTQILNAQGQNITAEVTGGSLGGALSMRDTTVPSLLSSLDQFATEFSSAVNSAQAMGYDQNGNPGQPVFSVPSNGTGAAAGMSVALTTGSALAVSSDGSSASSGNLTNLLAVQSSALPSGQTPTDTYATLTQTVGAASANVTSNLTATTAVLSQLTTQQASESGVSIDEETTNLLRYQQAYSAAAQVITTVNNLFTVVLNMGMVSA